MNEKMALVGLNMVSCLGPVRVRSLLETFGHAAAIYGASVDDLCLTRGIGSVLAEKIRSQLDILDIDAEFRKADKLGIHIITWDDPDYPLHLKGIYDPPIVLYIMGTITDADHHGLAVIGSRRCSMYGLRVSDQFSFQLAKMGYTIISGLAIGIDTAAHQGALKAGGRTIAVLGSALDEIYPSENVELAKEIAKNGALISEYPFGRKPDKTTFPYRNRIVSGMSEGVIVTESPLKSGALITADIALEHGKQLFAIPGRIDSPGSHGCHKLIKQGAKLVERVQDIIEEYEFLFPAEKYSALEQKTKRPEVTLTADEADVVKCLGMGELDVDTLARNAKKTSQQLSVVLFGLEMKKVIRMLPGRIVELVVQATDFR